MHENIITIKLTLVTKHATVKTKESTTDSAHNLNPCK